MRPLFYLIYARGGDGPVPLMPMPCRRRLFYTARMTSRAIEIKNVHASFTQRDYRQAVVGEDFSPERSEEEDPDNGARCSVCSCLVFTHFYQSSWYKQTLTRAILFIAAAIDRDRIAGKENTDYVLVIDPVLDPRSRGSSRFDVKPRD
jgi:hypothetical protein